MCYIVVWQPRVISVECPTLCFRPVGLLRPTTRGEVGILLYVVDYQIIAIFKNKII